MSILDKIIETKKDEILLAKQAQSIEQIKLKAKEYKPRGFKKRIESTPFPSIIAEIKRASPSKGLIRPDLDPVATASDYFRGGAACISVLTDEQYFKGHISFLTKIRSSVPDIPLLRKDFIIDPYQIWEARAFGADAILLIVKALQPETLTSLLLEANSAELDVLLEIHDNDELNSAFEIISRLRQNNQISLPLLGINNRNLNTFITDIKTTGEIIQHLQEKYPTFAKDLTIVSESGIFTARDIVNLRDFGANAFLIGESLVAKGNPGENIEAIINESRQYAEQ